MQAERIKILEEFIAQEPDDVFNYYALGIELISTDSEKTIELFEIVLKKNPEYLPVYYHLASLYFNRNMNIEAESIYSKGIALAELQNNTKALKELKGAYQQFLDEIND